MPRNLRPWIEMALLGAAFLAVVCSVLFCAGAVRADPPWAILRVGAIGAPEAVLGAGTRTYRWYPEKTGAALRVWNGTALPCKSAGGVPVRVGQAGVWTGTTSKGACLSPEGPGLVYYR